jgi:hypothetical protein
MSEFWTYRPSDFLLFAPRTYYRLFELYNADIWPLQLVALLAGVAILALMRSHVAWRGRAIAVILAACWLWVAWAFHWQRYAAINWTASYFAAAFAIEAVLLLWIGATRDGLTFDSSASLKVRAGIAIFLFGLMVQPVLGLLAGRSWLQVGVFGVAPDPTAVATLGLLCASGRTRIALLIPLLWCIVNGATLWALQSAEAFVLLGIAALALLLCSRWQPLAR